MIVVNVLYANTPGSRFDLSYYCTRHIPMVQQKLGAACRKVDVHAGVGGGAPNTPPAFLAMAHLYFDSAEAFQQAFGPHADAILSDIPNYTNVQPTIQMSDVKQ